MSKRTRERDFVSDLNESEFERALEETEHRKTDRGRRIEQKTRQLCQQAHRALNLALAARSAGGALDGVFVIEVSAAVFETHRDGAPVRLKDGVSKFEEKPRAALMIFVRQDESAFYTANSTT